MDTIPKIRVTRLTGGGRRRVRGTEIGIRPHRTTVVSIAIHRAQARSSPHDDPVHPRTRVKRRERTSLRPRECPDPICYLVCYLLGPGPTRGVFGDRGDQISRRGARRFFLSLTAHRLRDKVLRAACALYVTFFTQPRTTLLNQSRYRINPTRSQGLKHIQVEV